MRGSPPVPEDDVTTLQVSFYLVGKKSLDNDMIAGFTQAMTSARRDLMAELPILAQFKAPDAEAGAYLPVHAGAAEFYNGSQQTFLDKWSNAIFLAPLALGALASIADGGLAISQVRRAQAEGTGARFALCPRAKDKAGRKRIGSVGDRKSD